jgi:hypothetical protein
MPGSGCVSFMAKASDNITIILTSTQPNTQQIASTDSQTLQGKLSPIPQTSPPTSHQQSPTPTITYSFSDTESSQPSNQHHSHLSPPQPHSANNSPSLLAYPVSPPLHQIAGSTLPALALSPLDGAVADHQPQQMYPSQ